MARSSRSRAVLAVAALAAGTAGITVSQAVASAPTPSRQAISIPGVSVPTLSVPTLPLPTVPLPTTTLPTPTVPTTPTTPTGTGTTKTTPGGTGTTGTGTTGTTGSGTGSGSGNSNLTPAQIAYFEALVAYIEKLDKELAAANTHGGYILITKLTRAGQKLTAALTCTASSNRSCSSTLTVIGGHHSTSKHVTLKGGAAKQVILTLPSAMTSGPVTVTAKTGAVSTSKTLG